MPGNPFCILLVCLLYSICIASQCEQVKSDAGHCDPFCFSFFFLAYVHCVDSLIVMFLFTGPMIMFIVIEGSILEINYYSDI